MSFVPLDATFSAGQYAELAHAEIDDLLAAGRRPIVVGGTGLYLRAALARARPAPASAGGGAGALAGGARAHGVPGRCTPLLAERAPWAAEEIDPNDRQRVVRALELLRPRRARAARGTLPAVEPRASPPDPAGRADDGARRALRARSTSASSGCSRQGAREEVAPRQRRRRLRDGPPARWASRSCSRATSERDEARTRNYAKRQLTWMRKLADVQLIDVSIANPSRPREIQRR